MSTSVASMPVGFRFRPTDDELINHYLKRKIRGQKEKDEVIPEIDVCGFEPWDLPEQSPIKSGDLEWFFFSSRKRKYPNGQRSQRATKAGYWKLTGKERPIKSRGGEVQIGLKRTLVFYIGRAPNAVKTVWIMHEYRRISNSSSENAGDEAIANEDSYVLCRLFKQPEETSPNQNSIEAEDRVLSSTLILSRPSEVVSEMPSNQTNIEFGTLENLPECPVDEVDSITPPVMRPGGSNPTEEPVDIDDLGAEVYPMGLLLDTLRSFEEAEGRETVSGELLVINSNNEFLDGFHPSEVVSEMPSSQTNIEFGTQENLPECLVDEVDSIAPPVMRPGGSNPTEEPVDIDDLGAEMDIFFDTLPDSEEPEGRETVSGELPVIDSNDEFLDDFLQISHLNSREFEKYESENFTNYLDFHEYIVNEVNSTVLPAAILEGMNVTAEPVHVNDLGAKIDLGSNAICSSEEPGGGETDSHELPTTNSNNEFLDAFPQISYLSSWGFENYESEEFTKILDSMLSPDDSPCGLNHDINDMLINPGMDNTDIQIPGEDSIAGITDSVHYITSSSHSLRKIPSKNPMVEHSWADGCAVIHEFLSEGCDKQDGGTGIRIRSRQAESSGPDFDNKRQCSPPTRIRLMKLQATQVKNLTDGELLKRRRLPLVAIVLATLALVLVSVGWKWING